MTWLDAFAEAAREAEAAETRYRADFARRVAELAEARAVAHRRANLMAALAVSETSCETEDQAIAHGLAALRGRLGWASESEARTEILDRFRPVCAAVHAAAAGTDDTEAPDPAEALAAFETWYREARGSTFWILFENVMPETPRVDW